MAATARYVDEDPRILRTRKASKVSGLCLGDMGRGENYQCRDALVIPTVSLERNFTTNFHLAIDLVEVTMTTYANRSIC
jgi:hypothetical protein